MILFEPLALLDVADELSSEWAGPYTRRLPRSLVSASIEYACPIHQTSSREKVPRRASCPEREPDIVFVVGQLSRPNSDSRLGYVRAATRVVRYLERSMGPEDRKSVLGCCYFMGEALGSWSNKKQRTLSASTDNAKRIALGRASRADV